MVHCAVGTTTRAAKLEQKMPLLISHARMQRHQITDVAQVHLHRVLLWDQVYGDNA